ncbi:MAG TPA: 5-methyltetrahydropteroyltriglutamate--homocysteine S-methyltransferase [Terriglobales bacterium]|nr:5-methyltetrahydropteroyltriglutamate--homocysteine S-methyltransferase [Terriglobales bacterium]
MITANLGFPRMGANRELKFAIERYWSGNGNRQGLDDVARGLRRAHWRMQADAGIQHIPSNDFSLYDHVLDAAVMVGAIPARFRNRASDNALDNYFTMARGGQAVRAMEMTKWFDTNYHYIVPEFEDGMEFRLNSEKPLGEFLEAKALGLLTRPVILGPASFALLGKCTGRQRNRLEIAERLLPIYEQLLSTLAAAGATWVQIDEPFLAMDLEPSERLRFARIYDRLGSVAQAPKILLATYFSGLQENLPLALSLPIAALHLDLVRDPEQLRPTLTRVPDAMKLSLGVVDGRNIWRADLDGALALLNIAFDRIGSDRIQIAPSCSLLHVPVDLDNERALDPTLRSWMAFARQKLEEVSFLARAASEESSAIGEHLAENRRILEQRRSSPQVCNASVRAKTEAIDDSHLKRQSDFPARQLRQAAALQLPALPTTTIGSFPQTAEIRRARAAFRAHQLTAAEYEGFLRAEIERAIRFQEDVGLDVLVHGEFERNDMVEYFAEQLAGYAFTSNGWVQSYGSRCVKPPVLFGDVDRQAPMSVRWSQFAQSLTARPVKGMLTGPVTMLQWSFVRDDLPRKAVCHQLALALRDEVQDLERAGIRVIQVDEPALREGLPLRRQDRPEYVRWAVAAFRLATAGVRDETQIHTHMCYSEFGDILSAIKEMDADVISIEAARSQMELFQQLSPNEYPNCIGPGVYDIHSPRIPDADEFEGLIREALMVFNPEQLWINPDCGLKTRRWEEIGPALRNMVRAAERLRAELPHDERAALAAVPGHPAANWPYQACNCT